MKNLDLCYLIQKSLLSKTGHRRLCLSSSMLHRCVDIRGTTIVYRHRSLFPSILLSLHVRGRDENYILSFSFFPLSITTRCVYVLEVRCAHPRTANRRFLLFFPLFIFSSIFSGIADIGWVLVFYTEAKRANDTKRRREEIVVVVVVVVSLCVGRYTGRSQRLT